MFFGHYVWSIFIIVILKRFSEFLISSIQHTKRNYCKKNEIQLNVYFLSIVSYWPLDRTRIVYNFKFEIKTQWDFIVEIILVLFFSQHVDFYFNIYIKHISYVSSKYLKKHNFWKIVSSTSSLFLFNFEHNCNLEYLNISIT